MAKSLRRHPSRGRGIAAGIALIGTVAALAATASTAGAGVAMRALPGETLHLTGARDLGPLSPSKQIVVAITVRHDLNALYRAEWAMYRSSSPSYHHFLSVAGFRRQYGTSASVVNAIRAFGTAHGLKLFNPNTLYDYVELSGTAQQVERTFSVRLDRYTEHGVSFYANAQSPMVPAGLPIDSVLGLENLSPTSPPTCIAPSTGRSAVPPPRASPPPSARGSRAGPSPARRPRRAAPPARAARRSRATADPTGSESLCTGLLSPQELWQAYDAPGSGMKAPGGDTDFGSQTIGIIGEGQTLDVIAALREFEKTRGLPAVPVQVYHTDPGAQAAESTLDDSGRIEWEMDTQSSTGMAPDVSQLRMYFGSSLALTELSGAIGAWVNDPDGPLQVSASLGACEDSPAVDPLYGAAQRADQAELIQAAMEGRTFFASAGDTGPGCSVAVSENGIQYGPIPGPEYPSIDPNTVAVGGTILYTNSSGQNVLERAWDHTGGAPSKWLPQPPWQANAGAELESNACPGVYGNGQPFPGGGNFCRAGNDVSAESGDITISLDHKIGDVESPYDPTNSQRTTRCRRTDSTWSTSAPTARCRASSRRTAARAPRARCAATRRTPRMEAARRRAPTRPPSNSPNENGRR